MQRPARSRHGDAGPHPQQPWLLPILVARIAVAWARLWIRSRGLREVDLVVVGYMGHFDVHLARRLWPDVPVVLDHLISASDTALDRGARPGLVVRLLERLDRAALEAADVPCVDTSGHLGVHPWRGPRPCSVVPVGAAEEWFHHPDAHPGRPLRVVFFGSFTPLQGTPVIGGEAAGLLASEPSIHLTLIGRGQDYEATRAAAAANESVEWIDWVDPDELPEVVATTYVCLGVFGTGPKALRVVPNKVFQGAAAGAAIVTSDTHAQRETPVLAAMYVPPGDACALADAVIVLASNPERLAELRAAAYERAMLSFRPASVTAPLYARVASVAA